MELDNEKYRKAYLELEKWNESDFKERIRSGRFLTPVEAWERYSALWVLLSKFPPEELDRMHEEHIKYWSD